MKRGESTLSDREVKRKEMDIDGKTRVGWRR